MVTSHFRVFTFIYIRPILIRPIMFNAWNQNEYKQYILKKILQILIF